LSKTGQIQKEQFNNGENREYKPKTPDKNKTAHKTEDDPRQRRKRVNNAYYRA